MTTTGATTEVLDGDGFRAAVPELATLLVDAVDSGASVSFLAGLDEPAAGAWWMAQAPRVETGELVPVVARLAGRIVGCVFLVPSTRANSPHRAEIVKMLVHRAARRQGIATRLLAAAEAEALARGRTLLVLDTVSGSPAERLYRRLGWQETGVVPGYALDVDGRPEAAVFLWKALRPASRD